MTENVKASPNKGPKALEGNSLVMEKAETKYQDSVFKSWILNTLKGCLSTEI